MSSPLIPKAIKLPPEYTASLVDLDYPELWEGELSNYQQMAKEIMNTKGLGALELKEIGSYQERSDRVPKGYTANLVDVGYPEDWEGEDSLYQQMARAVGLQKAEPVMRSRQEGKGEVMFKSGGTYYFWVQITGDVWEILSSKELDEIIQIVNAKGSKALELERIGSHQGC